VSKDVKFLEIFNRGKKRLRTGRKPGRNGKNWKNKKKVEVKNFIVLLDYF
jgi:hypothetical protein